MKVINTCESIANAVLNDGESISDVAKALKISPTRARQKLHAYCKNSNKELYDSLSRPIHYSWGVSVLRKHLPLMHELKANKLFFLKKHDTVFGI